MRTGGRSERPVHPCRRKRPGPPAPAGITDSQLRIIQLDVAWWHTAVMSDNRGMHSIGRTGTGGGRPGCALRGGAGRGSRAAGTGRGAGRCERGRVWPSRADFSDLVDDGEAVPPHRVREPL